MPTRGAHSAPKQQLIWVEDDVLYVRSQGTFELSDMERLMTAGDELAARYGYLLLLIDARQATGLSAAARKYQSERLVNKLHPSYTAIHGAATAVRLLSDLVQRGIALITGKTYPVGFYKDEALARAAIDAHRVLLKASRPPAGPDLRADLR